jgi:hypothetical protein
VPADQHKSITSRAKSSGFRQNLSLLPASAANITTPVHIYRTKLSRSFAVTMGGAMTQTETVELARQFHASDPAAPPFPGEATRDPAALGSDLQLALHALQAYGKANVGSLSAIVLGGNA